MCKDSLLLPVPFWMSCRVTETYATIKLHCFFIFFKLDAVFFLSYSNSTGCNWTDIQPVRAVSPSFPSHSRWASTMFVLRGISGEPKTPPYWNTSNTNRKECSDMTENNLADLASTVFGNYWTCGRIGAFSRNLSTDLCGVNMRLSSLGTNTTP